MLGLAFGWTIYTVMGQKVGFRIAGKKVEMISKAVKC